MRVLRPDSRKGIITAHRPHMQAGGPTKQYKKPNESLRRLDSLLQGAKLNICIIRSTGGIGDVLMTLPTVRAIKKKYDCVLTYATDYNYLNGALLKTVQGNPYIDNIINWGDIVASDYDAMIDLTCPCIVHEKPKAIPINRIDLFARHAGVQLESKKIDFKLREDELRWGKEYIQHRKLAGKKIILVQPFSSSQRRDSPVATLRNALAGILTVRKDIGVIVLTHGTDSSVQDWKYSEIVQVHNLDIRQIGAVMQHCNLVLCPDSSVLHLAGALGKPTVSLFGPTDPRARVNHYSKAIAIWPGGRLACSPCWYDQTTQCGSVCWKMVTPEMILETVIEALSGRVSPKDFLVFSNDMNSSGENFIGPQGEYELL